MCAPNRAFGAYLYYVIYTLVQAQKHYDYFGSFPTEEITTFPISSYVLVDYGKQGPPDRRTWIWRGPYRVVKRDEEDPDRYTVQNLVMMKIQNFPTSQLKLFIADDRRLSSETLRKRGESVPQIGVLVLIYVILYIP